MVLIVKLAAASSKRMSGSSPHSATFLLSIEFSLASLYTYINVSNSNTCKCLYPADSVTKICHSWLCGREPTTVLQWCWRVRKCNCAIARVTCVKNRNSCCELASSYGQITLVSVTYRIDDIYNINSWLWNQESTLSILTDYR